ncbi:DUF2623 family protein [Burkholderia gladioli]|uniref:DUF2623 domain-containing protein n=1 Tax=Burkholderia TaxID=32008 RepID=UPI0016415F2C|nr:MULTISPECIES: DUF2623 domain-containing protein [Burkholderia]UEC02601.1 DUF2623 domain-containing protein [Burkholderia vietnamiensis]
MATKSRKPQSALNAGYEAGMQADVEPSDYDMSFFEPDYRLGFVLGHSTAESIRRASPMAAAVMAADLGPRYNVPLDVLLEQMELPDDLCGIVEEAYEPGDPDDDESEEDDLA